MSKSRIFHSKRKIQTRKYILHKLYILRKNQRSKICEKCKMLITLFFLFSFFPISLFFSHCFFSWNFAKSTKKSPRTKPLFPLQEQNLYFHSTRKIRRYIYYLHFQSANLICYTCNSFL